MARLALSSPRFRLSPASLLYPCLKVEIRAGAFGTYCAARSRLFFRPIILRLFVDSACEQSGLFVQRGGHPWALFIGSLFGFGTFYLWLYEFSHH